MKTISKHMRKIAVPLAAVALLLTAVCCSTMLGNFGYKAGLPTILDGAHLTFGRNTTAPLMFRSSAAVGTFQEVKVDGKTVDPSNYTVTEGSTIVTFTDEFATSLDNGNHTVAIVSKTGTASTFFSVVDYDHNASELHPTGVSVRDNKYEYGDYVYKTNGSTWSVELNLNVTNKSQTAYGPILESINGKPITRLYGTFSGCTKLTTAPVIPEGVTNIDHLFEGCVSLTDISNMEIPSGVVDLLYTFKGCTALKEVPVIPSNVTRMWNTFEGCVSLATAPILPSRVNSIYAAFKGCTSLTAAPAIPETVLDMGRAFEGCTSLTVAPDLSDLKKLSSMSYAFKNCTSLTTAPVIPVGVTSIDQLFRGCTALKTAPVIPNSVKSMDLLFADCTSLSGTITVNANPTNYSDCFNGTRQQIHLVGASNMLYSLQLTAKTGNVYCD